MTDTLLDARDVAITFHTARGPVRAVDGLDLSVGRGETVGVVGESGSGKSAFALSLLGLLPGYAEVTGSVTFDGVPLLADAARAARQLRGRGIGMVFQDPGASLNPVRTVGGQLRETLRVLRGLSGAAATAAAAELLDRVGLPEPRRQLAAYPHELSGGMRQRVMIALALAGEPELLIADEATTALDVSVQAQILTLLREIIAERHMSLLLITHDLGVAASVADRIAVMYSGRLAETGGTAEVFAAPRHPYTRALLACVPDLAGERTATMTGIPGQAPDPLLRPAFCAFADRCAQVHERCTTELPPLTVRSADGTHRAACWATEGSTAPLPAPSAPDTDANVVGAPGETLLDVRDLRVSYRVRKAFLRSGPSTMVAVRGLNLSLRAGETLGLVGESGSGKSSTATAILRLAGQTTGRILFEGNDIAGLPERRLRPLRTRLQLVMQDITTSLSPRFTVAEAILEPVRAHRIPMPGGKAKFVAELLESVSLSPELADRPARELSGGQRQRVNLARALATGPKLVIADEPTSALDVSVRAQILNLMARLQRERGLAYLFISHDLTVIRQMSDRIAVLYLGKVVEIADTAALFRHPQHPYTRALLAAVPTVGRRDVTPIRGEQPSPLRPPSGCPFRTRCPRAQDVCATQEPELAETSGGQSVACFFPGDRDAVPGEPVGAR